jgi:hypothetical protein
MGRNERIKIHSAPKLFDVVELLSSRPGASPTAGALGTIVEELPGDSYLVEFCDDEGRTISIETLTAADVAVRR